MTVTLTPATDLHRTVEEAFSRVNGEMVLAAPLGVGKPIRSVNAVYRYASDHPATRLTIVTALTLDDSTPSSELGRRLAEPIVDRLSGNGPQPIWRADQVSGEIPPNVEVRDFYLAPGRSLAVPAAQQSHISANYHHVAALLADMGTNALAQLVSPEREGQVSLGTNPDVSLRLLDHLDRKRADGHPAVTLAEIAIEMPHLGGEALVDIDRFDFVTEQVDRTPLFGIPNPPVGRTDAALGCLAASLIPDGGTLQIGIGALGDGVAAGVDLRNRDSDRFARVVEDLADPDDLQLTRSLGGTGPFGLGLYVSSEMLSDSLLSLYESGVVSRRVTVDPVLQDALNGRPKLNVPTIELLVYLAEAGVIQSPMTGTDVLRLADAGIFDTRTSFREGRIIQEGGTPLDPAIGGHLTEILGPHLDGPAIHAAFAAGSPSFYERLRDHAGSIPLEMVDVGFTNTLLGAESLKRLQRRDARFINASMQVTCLGEAASDTLDDGRVVSGVGGQHDFVTQAHDLEDARSIIVARATRTEGGKVQSNIVWDHGHPTIPRHLRDIVVTEYGIADVRGKSDAETIAAMIEIADARFQRALVSRARKVGKLPRGFEIPLRARENHPQRVDSALADDPIPRYPFGTVVTQVEDELRQALSLLEDVGPHPRSWPRWDAIKKAPGTPPKRLLPHLRRLGLEEPNSWRERLMAGAVVAALEETGVRDE